MTYITTITVEGQPWRGPEIEADSWEEAQAQLSAAKAELTGVLAPLDHDATT